MPIAMETDPPTGYCTGEMTSAKGNVNVKHFTVEKTELYI